MAASWLPTGVMLRTIVAASAISVSANSSDAGGSIGALRRYESTNLGMVVAEPPGFFVEGAEASRSAQILVSMFGHSYSLKLYPANILGEDCSVEEDTPAGIVVRPCRRLVYFGTVDGMPKAAARVTIDNGSISLRLDSGEDVYYLEPRSKFDPTAGVEELVAYRASDARLEPLGNGGRDCATLEGEAKRDVSNYVFDFPGCYPYPTLGQSKFLGLELRAIADSGYLAPPTSSADCANNQCGGGSEAEIQSTVADLRDIFLNRFNRWLRLSSVKLGLAGTGISSNSTNVLQITNQMVAYKSNTSCVVSNVDQLFTTRNLVSSFGEDVRGATKIGGEPSSQGVSIVERQLTGELRLRLSGHELGHAVGACHIQDPSPQAEPCTNLSSACMNPASSDQGTLMTPTLANISKNYFDGGCNMLRVRSHNVSINQFCSSVASCGAATGGVIVTATDAQLALRMAVGAALSNPLADIGQYIDAATFQSYGTIGDGQVLASDALRILDAAVGNLYVCTCGGATSSF